MADPMANRFEKQLEKKKLGDRARRGMTDEEIEAEEKLLKETKKIDPLQATGKVNRNDPCPCGSGKKYKKCCGIEK